MKQKASRMVGVRKDRLDDKASEFGIQIKMMFAKSEPVAGVSRPARKVPEWLVSPASECTDGPTNAAEVAAPALVDVGQAPRG